MTVVIYSELHFKAVFGHLPHGDGHYPSVVDQVVDRFSLKLFLYILGKLLNRQFVG